MILAALKEQDWCFVTDYLLTDDNYGAGAEVLAREIADRNELRLERVQQSDRAGYKFWRWE